MRPIHSYRHLLTELFRNSRLLSDILISSTHGYCVRPPYLQRNTTIHTLSIFYILLQLLLSGFRVHLTLYTYTSFSDILEKKKMLFEYTFFIVERYVGSVNYSCSFRHY